MANMKDSAMDKFFQTIAEQRASATKAKSDQEVAMLDSLLALEIEQLRQDKLFMREKGIELPDQDITGDFDKIIALTGNTDMQTQLGLMLDEARGANELINASITNYNKGKRDAKLAQTQGDMFTEGEEGMDKYLFNAEERSKSIEKFGGMDATDAYMQGFDEGSTTIDQAMEKIAIDQQLQQGNIALASQKIEIAEGMNFQLMDSIGGRLTNSMNAAGIPVLLYRDAMMPGDEYEGQRESYVDLLNSWESDTSWIPNIKGEFITAMQQWADPSEGVNNNAGFISMASKAYAAAQYNERKEIEMTNVGIERGEAVMLLTDKSSDYYDIEYVNNTYRLQESKSIGIMPDLHTIQSSAAVIEQINSIENTKFDIIREDALQLSGSTGLGYDEIYDNLTPTNPGNFESRLFSTTASASYDDIFGDNEEINIDEFNLNSDIKLDPSLSSEYVKDYTSAKGESKSLKSGGIVKGKTINESITVERKERDASGKETGKMETVRDYKNASYLALNAELLNTIPGLEFEMYRLMEDNQNLGVRLGSFDKLQATNYIPTPEELIDVQAKVQKHVDMLLDPSTRISYDNQNPLASFLESFPGVSLITAAAGGVPGQGLDQVINNKPKAKEIAMLWNAYKERWNQLRKSNGLQSIAIDNLNTIGL